MLIISAPDYVHRQVGGYPFAIRPVGPASASSNGELRYVMFTGKLSDVQLTDFRQGHAVGGTAGGNGNIAGVSADASKSPAVKSDAKKTDSEKKSPAENSKKASAPAKP